MMRDVMLIIHFISIALLIGSGLATFIVNKIANKKAPEIAIEINKAILPLVYVLKLGITLLILSGGYLMTPYWAVLGAMPLLATKLVLVVIALVVIFIASSTVRKIKKKGNTSLLSKYSTLQNIVLLLGFVTLVLAVLTFH